MKKLVLVDGTSIAYRSFFGVPLLSNAKGIHTNAIYGFTNIIMKILEAEKPTHMLIAFDAGKTTFRHATYEDYKGGRPSMPPELAEQLPFLNELLRAYNIPFYQLPNYEADDIIGTLSLEADKENFTVKVISGDRDLTQLASTNVTVDITKKGITEVDSYTPDFIMNKYGISADRIVDLKGLMGDSSDNIPGVPGVGEKTALKLLHQFGSIENLYESLADVSGVKLKEKLEQNRELAFMSKNLATIMREAPLEVSLTDTELHPYEQETLTNFFMEMGFHSLLNKLQIDMPSTPFVEVSFETILTMNEKVLTPTATILVEVVDAVYHKAPIIGFTVVNENGNFFIPTDIALDSKEFIAWLGDEQIKKATYDAKRAIVALKWHGVELNGVDFDLLVAAYVLNPSATVTDVSTIAKQKNYTDVKADEEVYGKGAKFAIPFEDELSEHLIRKTVAVHFLKEILISELKKNKQMDLLTEVELPLSYVLAEMEYKGIKVDVEQLQEMGRELRKRISSIEERIHTLAGETFNINSPKQLGVILFEKLELPPSKKTKTGYSTSADVLEGLREKHEIIEDILNYRQLSKLQSTYVEGLLKIVHGDSQHVHTIFNQVLAQTGRLSSTDPNLQNIPIRLEEGRKIRQAFIPSKEGWVIFAADYSQIELRVLAHIANDEKLCEAFLNDMDVHTKTAMDVFHVQADEVDSNMRRQAKAVNFGIVYGISDFGLSQNLGITRKEAALFIERYLESFSGVREYMDVIVQEAKQKGYVTTLLNRRRYLPDITSSNFNLRSFAERTAMNTPIQGSAADIIKVAMIEMDKRLKKEKLQTRLLLQVHDELIFEAPKEEIEILERIVPEVMEQALALSVPLKVDYNTGATWYDAK